MYGNKCLSVLPYIHSCTCTSRTPGYDHSLSTTPFTPLIAIYWNLLKCLMQVHMKSVMYISSLLIRNNFLIFQNRTWTPYIILWVYPSISMIKIFWYFKWYITGTVFSDWHACFWIRLLLKYYFLGFFCRYEKVDDIEN